MKKLIILSVLGLFTFVSKGQLSNTNVVIETSKMDVVYGGLENPLSIAISDILPENVYLTTNKGLIKGMNGNYVLWVPFDEKGTVEIDILANISGKIAKISTRTFRILEVPKPVAYFGSKTGGEISKGEIMLVNFINAALYDFTFEGLKYTVTKYKFVYTTKKGKKSAVFETNGPALTTEMKDALKSSKKGDMIIISEIYVNFPGSSEIRLPGSIVLTVK